MRSRVAYLVVVAALAAAVLQAQTPSTPPSSPATPQGHEQHQPAETPPPADDDHQHVSSGSPQQMMGRGQMMQMGAHGADLEALRARMNEASGDEQIAAIVALLNALVSERAMMHEHMMQMMQKMQSSTDHAHDPAR